MHRPQAPRPRRVDVVIVGAGHCGLAMSHVLARRGVEHIVIERGDVAHAWRTERWDSLALLTPNWMCRLPGHAYDGEDPDGFMRAGEVAAFLTGYAACQRAPLRTHTTVRRVSRTEGGYRVETDGGDWSCRAVVLASGACSLPQVPSVAADVPRSVAQWTPRSYRRPSDLDAGGVLVVGASATGLQLALELRRSGRRVLLATGEHVRMPRLYRGRDVQWWLLASGVLDQRIEEIDDPLRARRLPSPQLAGSAGRTTIDLNVAQARGVELCGRLAGIRGTRALFSGSLRNVCALADLKMNRLLDTFDDWARRHGVDGEVGDVQRYAATQLAAPPRLAADLGREVRSIVWATGYRPHFGWLDVPVFDRRGELRHDRGVVEAPGLYVLGLPFMRRRKSSFIHGAEDDAREIAGHLLGHLERAARGTVRECGVATAAATADAPPAPSGPAWPGSPSGNRDIATGLR
ncbi:MAG: NAD(P)-binding domain-containing protein [Rubrivivax sp.]|nr:NAD(P)-binding domain-containing protein [Rubrivivax sp.]